MMNTISHHRSSSSGEFKLPIFGNTTSGPVVGGNNNNNSSNNNSNSSNTTTATISSTPLSPTSTSSTSPIKISNPVSTSNNNTATTMYQSVISLSPPQESTSSEEMMMNLSQLLACFPEPPTYIPTNMNQQSKQRRDTFISAPIIIGKPQLESSTNSLVTIQNPSNNNNSNNNNNNNNNNTLAPISIALVNQSSNSTLIPSIVSSEEIPDSTSESSLSSNDVLNQSTNNLESLSISTSSVISNTTSTSNQNLTNSTGGNNSNNNTPNKKTNNNNISITTTTATGNRGSGGMVLSKSMSMDNIETITNEKNNNSNNSTPVKNEINNSNNNSNNNTPTKNSSPSSNNQVSPTPQLNNKQNHMTSTPTPQSHLSPSKRLTIAFGSFGRGNNNNTGSSGSSNSSQQPLNTIPPRWEINLNQLPSATTITTTNIGSPPDHHSHQATIHHPHFELFYKACRGDISMSSIEFNKILNLLLEMNINESIGLLEKSYEYILKPSAGNPLSASSSSIPTSKPKSLLTSVKSLVGDDFANIKLSKSILYFNSFGKTVPINQEFTDEIIFNSFTSKARKFKVYLGPPSKSHNITVTPKDGVITKKSQTTINFSVTLKSSIKLRRVVVIEIEGGIRYFVLIQMESNKTAFSQPLEESDFVLDKTVFGDLRIPRALAILKHSFVELGGLETDSVFRSPANSESELNICKDLLTREPLPTRDPHCIASLIKIYFRELPLLLLNEVPPCVFLSFATPSSSSTTPSASSPNGASTPAGVDYSSTTMEQDPLFIVNQLSELKKSTFLWLIDLLAHVSNHESVNKMTAKNLSIIFSPNLYISPPTCEPSDSFVISSRVVQFILEIIQFAKSL